MTMGDGKYMRLGKRIVHAHAPVGRQRVQESACMACGHILCSCPAEAPEPATRCCWKARGGFWCMCNRSSAIAKPYSPEPPKDALPEGWAMEGSTMWRHSPSGAWVQPFRVQPFRVLWAWSGTRGGTCTGAALAKTREEAMAAALASVAPVEQEPALRPGWCIITEGAYGHADPQTAVVYQLGDRCGEWHVVGGGNHPTLEAAMIRAEQLADPLTEPSKSEEWAQHKARL